MRNLIMKRKLNRLKKTLDHYFFFLKEHKEILKELVKPRGCSGNIKKELWKCASIKVSDNENRFLPEQCV